MSHLGMALAALEFSSEGYQRADAFHAGTVPEVFTSRRMAIALRHAGMRFRLNYARIPVTAVLDRLEVSAVTSPDARATAALQVIWDENDMELWANDIHRDALKLGDTYAHVWPDESGFPEIHVTSPLAVKIVYDPNFPRRKLFAVNTWIEEDGAGRADLYYPDRIERYVTKTKDGSLVSDERQWVPFADEQSNTGVLPNPFGAIPFFHFRTERPYGRPEHMDAYGAQDAINKHVTQQITANDFQSFPQRYLLSEMAGSAIPTTGASVDDDDWDDETNVDGVANVQSGAQTGPGTLLEFIGNNLKIGEFTAADPKVFLEPLEFYIQAIADTTGTPIHMFRAMGDAPSGESLRVREAPLIKKVRDRSVSFGSTWSEVLEFALATVGIAATVDVAWRDPQSVDTKDAWEVVALKVQNGVPLDVALHEAGYPLEEVREWLNAVAAPAADVPEQDVPVEETQ